MSVQKQQQKKSSLAVLPKLKVVGVGGAGGTMIDRIASAKIPAAEYIAINTDVQALDAIQSPAVKKIRIGQSLTRGSGTGMDPELGRAAIEKDAAIVENQLKDADIVFITAGLGGGTGSGAGPVVAELSKKTKALTIALLTKPFAFEGAKRMAIAEDALKKFHNRIDALITISNNQILNLTDTSSTLISAFGIVDDILLHGVSTISDILTVPGLVNVDFRDVRAILTNAGRVLLATGKSGGKTRADNAVKSVLYNPLIEGLSIKGATGLLFIVSGSDDLKMSEVDKIAKVLSQEVDKDAKIIFGAAIDENLKEEIKVTLIASGFPFLYSNESLFPLSPRDPSLSLRAAEVPIRSEQGREAISNTLPHGLTKEEESKTNKAEKVQIYEGDKYETEEIMAEKEAEEIQLEEELEVPAFLRKKLK